MNKELITVEKSILTGMQEALSYAKGKLKVKEHNISLQALPKKAFDVIPAEAGIQKKAKLIELLI